MKRKGTGSGFFINKFVVFLLVILLLGSTISMTKRLNRTKRKNKINTIIRFVIKNLREVDSLPEETHIKRRFPSINRSYRLILSGDYNEYQKVKIQIRTLENFQKIILLNERINDGNFRMERKNPGRIILSKSRKISLEVI